MSEAASGVRRYTFSRCIYMKIDHYHSVHILESMMLNHISQEKYYELRYSSFFSPLVAVVADNKQNIYCTDEYSGVKVHFLPLSVR